MDKKGCYKIAGLPLPKKIDKLVSYLIDDNVSYNKTYAYIDKMIKKDGYSLSILLTELVDKIYSVRDNLEVKYLAYVLSKLADLENRVAQSTFGDVYYAGLVGIFKSYDRIDK